MADYNLSLGIDGTLIFEELQKIKAAVSELQNLAKQNGAALTQSFTEAAKAGSEVAAQTIKITGQLQNEQKAVKDTAAQFQAMFDQLGKIAAGGAKAFDTSQLSKYFSNIKTGTVALTDFATKAGQAFDPAKIAEFNQQLRASEGPFDDLRATLQFIKDNIGDLQFSPEGSQELLGNIETLESALAAAAERAKQIGINLNEPEAIQALQNLQKATNKTEVDFNELKRAIDAANTELKLLPAGSAEFNTLSAAIENATNKLNAEAQSLDQLKAKLQNLTIKVGTETDIDKVAALNQEIDETRLAIDRLANAGKEGFDNLGNKIVAASDKVTTITTRIRAITNEIAGMAVKSGPRFDALRDEAAQLTDELRDTREQITLLSSDTRGLDAGIQIVQGLVGVFAAWQGAVALVGGENEELQKTLLKVNGAMALLQGLQQVGALLDKNSAANAAIRLFLTRQLTTATIAEAGATKGAAVAQSTLNAAMLANPIGVLVLAIAGIIAAYELYSHTIGAATDAEKQRRKELETIAEVEKKAADAIGSEEAELNELVATAKNEALTRSERQDAIDKINASYPEYLRSLSLENIYTQDSSDLISKH